MADTPTTTANNDNLLQSWFSKKMLTRLEPVTRLVEFAQKDELPLRSGKTATWNGWRSLGAASSVLGEGTSNSLPALSSRKVTATIAGYGRGHKITDVAQMTLLFDAINGSMDVLTDSAAKTVERICQMGIFKNDIARNQSTTGILSALMSSVASAMCAVTGTNNNSAHLFQFPAVFGTSCGRLSAVNKSAPSVSARLSVYALRKVMTPLRNQNARAFADGLMVGYSHPNALTVLRTDPTWKDWNVYQNSKETMYKGEVGISTEGVRFIASTECPRYAVTAHSVNMTFIFGQGAYGLTTLDGNVKMIVARGPDKSDPFDQNATATYKIYAAAACLNPSAGRILFTHEKL